MLDNPFHFSSYTTDVRDGITHASPDKTSSPRWFTHTVWTPAS